METTTGRPDLPEGYDPSRFPPFAVTVDVVILTMSGEVPRAPRGAVHEIGNTRGSPEGRQGPPVGGLGRPEGSLRVLLVRRGGAPFKGMWALPGGFKRPTETLDEAAKRELSEETGVDAASLLTQLGAYGDPGRDPRMNVVTIAYLTVLRDVGSIVAGTDAADAALIAVSDVLDGAVELAFDHARIVRDAVARVRAELEVSGIATAFLGGTFTMAELRAVYEAIWGVELDAANFRRSIVSEDGWVIPTGRRARPGPAGGRPAELFRAGQAWTHGGPIRRSQPGHEEGGDG